MTFIPNAAIDRAQPETLNSAESADFRPEPATSRDDTTPPEALAPADAPTTASTATDAPDPERPPAIADNEAAPPFPATPAPLLTPGLVIASRQRAGDPVLPPETVAAALAAPVTTAPARYDVITLMHAGATDDLAGRFAAAGHRVIRVLPPETPAIANSIMIPLPEVPAPPLERDAFILALLAEIRRAGEVAEAVILLDRPEWADAVVRARERWGWRVVVLAPADASTLSPVLSRAADLVVTAAAIVPTGGRLTPAPVVSGDASWSDLAAAVRNTFPRASIIVISFNTLAFTRLCVASVLANTAYPNYELILVDNGSTDGSAADLTDLATRYPHLQVILNDTNTGFGPANNQGLAVATGELLVLLNSDTMVPPGWLSRLTHHLTDPRLGLIGPATNRTCNEAQIVAPYSAYGDFLRFAQQHATEFDGRRQRIRMPMMFCVAFRRDLLDEVGLLDERFETGMFEDEDYALRVQAAGYETAWAADAYVHHAYHASIGKLLTAGQYHDLFTRNQSKFEEKWGICWERHRLPPPPTPSPPAGMPPA